MTADGIMAARGALSSVAAALNHFGSATMTVYCNWRKPWLRFLAVFWLMLRGVSRDGAVTAKTNALVYSCATLRHIHARSCSHVLLGAIARAHHVEGGVPIPAY